MGIVCECVCVCQRKRFLVSHIVAVTLFFGCDVGLAAVDIMSLLVHTPHFIIDEPLPKAKYVALHLKKYTSLMFKHMFLKHE